MIQTAALRATHRKPLIQFLGKNRWSGKHVAGPHPLAPPQIAGQFQEFVLKQNDPARRPQPSAQSSVSGVGSINSRSANGLPDEWDVSPLARSIPLRDGELDLIEGGGAN